MARRRPELEPGNPHPWVALALAYWSSGDQVQAEGQLLAGPAAGWALHQPGVSGPSGAGRVQSGPDRTLRAKSGRLSNNHTGL